MPPPRTGAVLQRLKIYPRINNNTDTDFKAAPRVVDVEDLTYNELTALMSQRAEQRRDAKAHRNYVFSDEDDTNMPVLIAAYELGAGVAAATPTVNCYEGNIKVASAAQAGNYGGVSTCMTITVFMSNGSKVLAHAGLEARVTYAAIKAVVAQIGVPVKKVVAAGVGILWGLGLEPYSMVTIDENRAAFLQRLRTEFRTVTAEYVDREGVIGVSADLERLT